MNAALRPLPTRVTPLQYERLTAARDRDGLSIQEHVRRALDTYLAEIEYQPPPAPPTPPPSPPAAPPRFVRRAARVPAKVVRR
jgi:hypothetical protein